MGRGLDRLPSPVNSSGCWCRHWPFPGADINSGINADIRAKADCNADCLHSLHQLFIQLDAVFIQQQHYSLYFRVKLMRTVSILMGCISLFFVSPAHAVNANSLCTDAAITAEKEHSIPKGLLQAISFVETGHTRQGKTSAWPWTVNVAGKGHYFKSKAAAEKFVSERKSKGVSSIDIGCFQINTKWHGDQFSSITTMFDPVSTANYAAKFLSALQKETGDWDTAVKKYHSRNKEKGAHYGKKVAAALGEFNASEKAQPETSGTIAFGKPLSRPARLGAIELAVFATSPPLISHKPLRPLFMEEQ